MLVEFVVAAGKKEHARSHMRVDSGAVSATGAGPAPEPADIVFTLTPPDADAVRAGALDLAVGFMRGQIKMAGDFGALLHLLPLTSGRAATVDVGPVLALQP